MPAKAEDVKRLVTGISVGQLVLRRMVPMWIHLKSREPFVFAGLWDCWRDPAGDKEVYSFTIITTEANALLHQRMTRWSAFSLFHPAS